MSITFLIKEH